MIKYLLFILILCLLFLYGLYSFVFRHPMKKRPNPYQIPDSPLYRGHGEKMLQCLSDMDTSPYEQVQICSLDGLTLHANLYVKNPSAPFILFFHGYHGVFGWDGYGIFKICQKYNLNLLMVDVRAHGNSAGDITFGIKERFDCRQWTEYIVQRFGDDLPILLAGVSMGAASVIMSTALALPHNVKGIISDCSFSEPCAMIKETIKQMKFPIFPIYHLVKMSAHLFGHFSLEEYSPLQAVQHMNIPLLLIHGNKDSIVPLYMCDLLYEKCASTKQKLIMDGADHANCSMVNYDLYEQVIFDFINTCCSI